MLLEQEALLTDKEKLLNKFSKTQDKLEKLKRIHKHSLKHSKTALQLEVLAPKTSIQTNDKLPTTQEIKSNEKTSEAKTSNERFNPHKSSTPRDLSPVSVSQNNIDITIQKEQGLSSVTHDDDMKKIELMKQRMDLMNEQQELRKLMDQQEEILKEKQNQIIIQQKLHRERLEQLNQLKNEKINNERQQEEPSFASCLNQNNLYNCKLSQPQFFDQIPLHNFAGNGRKSNNNFNASSQPINKIGYQPDTFYYNQPQFSNDFISEDNKMYHMIPKMQPSFINEQLKDVPVNQIDFLSHRDIPNAYQTPSIFNNQPINQFKYGMERCHTNFSFGMQPRYYDQDCQNQNWGNNQFACSNITEQNIPQQYLKPINQNMKPSQPKQEDNFPTPLIRKTQINGLGNQFMNLQIPDQNKCNQRINKDSEKKQVTNDKDLIDLINLKSNENCKGAFIETTEIIKNRQCSTSSDLNKKGYETGYETEDLEESRLIEDLFFIK